MTVQELTSAEIAEKTRLVAEEIADVSGVNVAPTKRGQLGKNIFTIGLTGAVGRQRVSLWSGIADIKVAGDKDEHQAVLRVREQARTLTKTVTFEQSSTHKPTRANEISLWPDRWPDRFPVAMPNGTTYKLHEFEAEDVGAWSSWDAARRRWKITGVATASAPATDMTLLTGMDETAYFIAELPKPAMTVASAHKALRASGLRKGWKRQGEWFFSPALKKDLEAIENRLSNGAHVKTRRLDMRKPESWDATSHEALQSIVLDRTRLFVRGYVSDVRTGHHKTLHLDGWHEVLRNREIESPRRRARVWD